MIFLQLSPVRLTPKAWCVSWKEIRRSEIQQTCYRGDCKFESFWELRNGLKPCLKLCFKRGCVHIGDDSSYVLTSTLNRHGCGRGFCLGSCFLPFLVTFPRTGACKERLEFKFHDLTEFWLGWHFTSVHAFSDFQLASESPCLDVVSSKTLNEVLCK